MGQATPSPRARSRTARVHTIELRGLEGGAAGQHHWVVVYAPHAHELCRRFVLEPSWLEAEVGRSSSCALQLDGASISRRHCRLQFSRDTWWLKDLGSLNGTYVNDQRIAQHPLANGDRVHIGEVVLQHLACDDLEAAYQQALREAMSTDGLTGAHNDRSFREQLAALFERTQREGQGLGLLMLDVDHFKNVNDRWGHPAGDRVLRELVQRAATVVPGDALLGRVGGEEFGVLLPSCDARSLRDTAEALRKVVATRTFEVLGDRIEVTVSLGVALSYPGEQTSTTLFRRADEQLYAAKRAGRNRVEG